MDGDDGGRVATGTSTAVGASFGAGGGAPVGDSFASPDSPAAKALFAAFRGDLMASVDASMAKVSGHVVRMLGDYDQGIQRQFADQGRQIG